MEKITQDIREILEREGMYLFGFCNIRDIKDRFLFEDKNVLVNIDYAISIAYILSDKILDEIDNAPTVLYAFHYKRVNNLLDLAALRVSTYLQQKDFNAIPIPASQIIDWENQRASVSHKHIAVRAGLGWLGRNNLVVNPRYGSRIRFSTVLTDMVLPESEQINIDCGDCSDCIKVCPACAIKESQTDFDRKGCFELLKEFSKRRGIGQYICGICVKACSGKTSS
ncbi:MAG: epoxyqueuosine reductase [Candidatus Omnitrophica bacterium]|nr:epoxyqueuosine reductase [Candidatus Omnitrophota bacterium]